jgi:CubicO group peptidase (beta-lactamase class C family)
MKTALTLALLACAARAQFPDDAAIEALIKDRIETTKTSTAIVIGTVDAGGMRAVGYGAIDAKTDKAPDGDTVFEIGSATKVFTAILLQDMIERGAMKLDDPVAKYLPPGVKMPTRGGKQITLLDLATHTSALPPMPDNFTPKDPANPYADYTVAQMYAFLSRVQLTRDIGAKYEYSNLGVGLLGHAIALKAGRPYEALVIDKICQPLAMNSTRITLTPELTARLATGHNANGAPAANWDIPTLAGAGAIRSSVNDMVKFVAANLGLPRSELSALMQKTHAVRFPNAAPGLDLALAWHVIHAFGNDLTWHNGSTGGYHSFIGFDQKARRGVVVLSNSAASIDDLGLHLLDDRIPLAKPKPAKPKTDRKVAAIDHAIYDTYVGKYELVPGVQLTFRRDGERLFTQLTGQPEFEIFPESKTDFFLTVVDAQLTFIVNDKGEATAVTLHQNGRDQTASRIK